MTRTFAVDSANDLTLGTDGNLAVIGALAAVTQVCAHAAKTILNEMVLAQGEGLPYFEAVWIGVPNIPVFEAAFRAAILAVEGVTDIVSVTFGRSGDVLSYAATISTVYGTGTFNG